MKSGRRCLRLVAISIMSLFFMAAPGWSATYHVDYAGGGDANDGLSAQSPFKHAPGDKNASANAARTKLRPGDRVVFKSGVVYAGTVNIGTSGASDAPIVYDGGSWGKGKAILDGEGVRSWLFRFPSKQSFVRITGFELRGGKKQVDTGALVDDPGGSDHIEVDGCVIHDTGSLEADTVNGLGVSSAGGTYWKVHNNLFYNCNTAVSFCPGSYNEIYENEVHDKIRWGLAIRTTHVDCKGNRIYGNRLHDIVYYDGKGPHTDFVIINTVGRGNIMDTDIHDNVFYNSGEFNDYGGTAMIFIVPSGQHGTDARIHGTRIWNNLFWNQHSYFAILVYPALGKISNLEIYNNSFFSKRAAGFLGVKDSNDNNLTDGLYVKNNSCKTGNTVVLWIPDASRLSNVQIDSNNWYSPYRLPFRAGDKYLNWTQWRALNYDKAGKGPQSDPRYVSEGGKVDLHLRGDSPCLGAGVPLGDRFAVDRDGMPRKKKWSIGAYEPSMPGPTGLGIVK